MLAISDIATCLLLSGIVFKTSNRSASDGQGCVQTLMNQRHFTRSFQFRGGSISLSLFLLFLVSTAPVLAQEQLSAQEIAATTRPAVVTVEALSEGQSIGFGSGFFIGQDGVLITNLHVVQDAHELQVTLDSGEIYDNVFFLARDDRRDLVILKIPATNVPTIEVGDDRLAAVGDPVYVLGNPLGFQGTFSDGILSSKRVEDGVNYLQITAPISEGSSGGPVMNQRGEAIGVATLTIVDGQNLNLAVPARYGSGMLTVGNAPVPFRDVASDFVSIDSDLGGFGAAVEPATGDSISEFDEMEPWEQQVLLQVEAVVALAEEHGLVWLDDGFTYDEIELNEIGSFSVWLHQGSYMATAVCDDDCDDLDLAVFDSDGNVLAVDVEADAIPTFSFAVDRADTFEFHVEMVSCEASFCAYSILLFSHL